MRRQMYYLATLMFIFLISQKGYAQEVVSVYKKLPNDFFEEPIPNDPVWKDVVASTISLLPQNITTPGLDKTSVSDITVKSLHNKKWVAIQMSWSDSSRNVNVDTDKASDACAVQFPVGSGDKTSPFMGATGAPVSIVHWKSIWQNDVIGKYQDVQDLHPNAWTDMYFFATGKRPFPVSTSFNSTAARNTLGAIYVKNPIAQLHREIPVEELVAEGFGTLTTQVQQDARGGGMWVDGRWTVVFARPLSVSDKQDPKLKVGEKTVVAFAIWDGGQKNVGGRKNYAPWVPFLLEVGHD